LAAEKAARLNTQQPPVSHNSKYIVYGCAVIANNEWLRNFNNIFL